MINASITNDFRWHEVQQIERRTETAASWILFVCPSESLSSDTSSQHQHHRRHGVSAGCPHSFLPRTRCSDDEKGARLISFRRHRPYSRRPERRGIAKKKLFDILRAFSAPILHYVPAPFAPAPQRGSRKSACRGAALR